MNALLGITAEITSAGWFCSYVGTFIRQLRLSRIMCVYTWVYLDTDYIMPEKSGQKIEPEEDTRFQG